MSYEQDMSGPHYRTMQTTTNRESVTFGKDTLQFIQEEENEDH